MQLQTFDVEYGFFDRLCTSLIQNTDILVTLGNTGAENKGLECQSLTITLKVGFQK